MNNDLITAALLATCCDLVSSCMCETRAIVDVLNQKGLVSHDEWLQARTRVLVDQEGLAASLRQQMQERFSAWLDEMRGPEKIQ